MLSSYDRRQFNDIVAGLLAEDPDFGSRDAAPPRPATPRPILAILLWFSMPFLVAAGGGTGLLVAVVAGAYAVHLYFRGRTPATPGD